MIDWGMNKIIFGIVVLFLLAGLFLFLRGNEDSWIKNEKGVYVKHGNPSDIPKEVSEQQEAISGAMELYNKAKESGMEFNSQCLGSVGDYAVDIVHVPRTEEDNLPENQCEDYRTGKVSHFIELDKDGNIVRVD